MAKWFVVQTPSGAVRSSEVLAIHAALLRTGKIVYFSGDEHDPGQNAANNINHSRLFNCGTLTVEPLGSPAFDTFCAGQALMDDGRLLVAGGTQVFDPFVGLADAAIFNPGTETWTAAADMAVPRWYPTLTTLANRKVLALSGEMGADPVKAELYSRTPSPSGSWTSPGATQRVTLYPRSHVVPEQPGLAGYTVFVSAGPSGATQLYNPTSNGWSNLGAGPGTEYGGFGTSSVLLPLMPEQGYAASVLVTGGEIARVFNLAVPTLGWRPTVRAPVPGFTTPPARTHSTAVLLPTGQVFVSGGTSSGGSDAGRVLAAEAYSTAGGWQTLESATVTRVYHSIALLMPDGRVWTAGSNRNSGRSFTPPVFPADSPPGWGNRELRFEIYEPWYFSRPRPAIAFAPSSVDWANAFTIETPNAASITRVAVMRAGSCTHAFDSDQRYVGLDFTRVGTNLQALSPPNGNIAPPGYYLLFVIDSAGVPSVGRFIRIGAPLLKIRKELKPEMKELFVETKRFLKVEVDLVKRFEIPPIPIPPDPLGDPVTLARLLAARVDDLEQRLATGSAFIRPEERPDIEEAAIRDALNRELSPAEEAILKDAWAALAQPVGEVPRLTGHEHGMGVPEFDAQAGHVQPDDHAQTHEPGHAADSPGHGREHTPVDAAVDTPGENRLKASRKKPKTGKDRPKTRRK